MIIFFSFIALVLLGSAAFSYFYFSQTTYSQREEIANPVLGMDDTQALDSFSAEYVTYLLYSLGAKDLKKPLIGENPKIEIYVDELIYGAEISKGIVYVTEGSFQKKDIIIRTSRIELIKMLRDNNHVQESFNSGASKIELVAKEPVLLTKGYMKIYQRIS